MNKEECYKKTVERFVQKQADVISRQLEHKKEIHQKIPKIAEIEEAMSDVACQFFSKMADNRLSEKEFKKLEETSLDLQRQRAELLAENGYSIDYLSKQYECSHCKDEGFVGTEMCKCFKKALSEEYLKNSNMQVIYKNKTFQKFDLTFYPEGEDRSKMEVIFSYCKNYVKRFDKTCVNILMLGQPGCGKTFLSCAIGTELIKNGKFVLYTPVQEMINDFETVKFGKGEADIDIYEQCDLLIIDDFGSEFKTSFAENVIYNVINNRLNMKKPIIISTNLTQDELEENYHERIVSRIFYEFAKLPFAEIDVRREKEKRLREKHHA